MQKQRDIAPLVKAVATVIREHVSKAFNALTGRLDDVEAKLAALPVPKDGEPGKAGRNAFEVAVSLGYEGTVHEWMESLQGKDGAPGEPGQKGDRGDIGQPGRDGVDGKDGAPGERGEPGLSGERGQDGVDGKSITVDDVRPIIDDFLKSVPLPKDGHDGLPGKDGQNGRDGIDGKSVTVDEIRPMMESELAKWALEFERRATDLIQRCIDRIEKPKDGAPGKDGRDAFALEEIQADLGDDGRTLTLAWVRGDERVARSLILPHVIYRGVHKHDQRYQRGDSVTFQGSTWIAMRDTSSKPETDDSWRLATKRGRDGKDGKNGDKGDRGPPGKVESR
jgi:collagen type III alpha